MVALACAIFPNIDLVAAYEIGANTTIQTPQEDKYDHKGSAFCRHLGTEPIDKNGEKFRQRAFRRFKDEVTYHEYTSPTFTYNGDGDGHKHKLGCTVFMLREDEGAYKIGMTGAQIKNAVKKLYAYEDFETCRSIRLTNGRRVTVNTCRKRKVVNEAKLAGRAQIGQDNNDMIATTRRCN